MSATYVGCIIFLLDSIVLQYGTGNSLRSWINHLWRLGGWAVGKRDWEQVGDGAGSRWETRVVSQHFRPQRDCSRHLQSHLKMNRQSPEGLFVLLLATEPSWFHPSRVCQMLFKHVVVIRPGSGHILNLQQGALSKKCSSHSPVALEPGQYHFPETSWGRRYNSLLQSPNIIVMGPLFYVLLKPSLLTPASFLLNGIFVLSHERDLKACWSDFVSVF